MPYPAFSRGLCAALLGVATAGASPVADYSVPYDFHTLAGFSSIGSSDGPGTIARFYWPSGVAVDAAGTIYVSDQKNNTIRKISPAGVVSTLAGTPGVRGATDGPGNVALFANPEGVAVDAAGYLYVADKINCTIRKISPDGMVTTIAGRAGVLGTADGPGTDARFSAPVGIGVDSTGNVFVADWLNNTIRKITPDGTVSTLAGTAGVFGGADGTGAAAEFFYPAGLTVDPTGIIYVAENGSGLVRRITPAGAVTTVPGAAPSIFASGIAVDRSGNLFVPDRGSIRKIATDGTSSTLAGNKDSLGSADGTGGAAQFRGPEGLAVDAAGNVVVADRDANTIRRITPAGVVTTVAGLGYDDSIGSNDGNESVARFNELATAAVAPSGDVYVADTMNSVIRRITPSGAVTTVAGSAGQPGSTDGKGGTARFAAPFGLAVDAANNVFVADAGNDTIRQISPDGTVTTVAGIPDGTSGSADGGRADARFNRPSGVALDGAGNILVADTGNNSIRKVTRAGEVTTLAGTPGISGSADGTGAGARFFQPTGVAVDSGGVLYVADSGNQLIRKMTPDGAVSTLAGNVVTDPDTNGADGAGAAAHFNGPQGLAVDGGGNVYVADSGNNTVRRISPTGVVTTLGGIPAVSGHADGVGRDARFFAPPGISVDTRGALFVTSGTTVRKGLLAGAPVISTQPASQSVPAGQNAQLAVSASGVPVPTYQWSFNGTIINGATASTLTLSNVSTADAGDYTVVVANSLGSITSNRATVTVSASTTPPAASGDTASAGGGALDASFALVVLAWAAVRGIAGRRGSGVETGN